MVLFNRTGMVYLTSLVKRFVELSGMTTSSTQQSTLGDIVVPPGQDIPSSNYLLQGNKELLLYAGRIKEDHQEATTKA